jgi:Ca2+-binding EF-hand superfamily protein
LVEGTDTESGTPATKQATKHQLQQVMKLSILLIAIQFLGGYALAGPKTFGDGSLPDFLATYDTNGDGMIDEEERQAMVEARKAAREERRAEIDTDGDGVISEEERQAARQAVRDRIEAKRQERFNEIAGEDGLLSLEEFSALPQFANVDPERVAALFNHLDTDDSGFVTFEEFTARLRRHRDRTGGGDGDPIDRDGPGVPEGPGGPGGR